MKIDKKDILAQLESICQSQDFASKPRMQKLLTYIITEYLEGREDRIKGYSIGVDVFEQGGNFDPDHNALVRINMGRLRRLLKFYYLEEGKNDRILIDIPKGRYVPTIVLNEGNSSQKPLAEKKEDLYKIGILVHPLKNLNGGDELEFLIHGFSHELGTALSKFDDINVFRYSNFDGKQKELDQLLDASKGIEFVIEGELTVFRNKAQIKVRLIDATDKGQIWGDSFTLDLEHDNLFESQDILANKIATNVGAEYGHINTYRMAEMEESKNVTLNEQKALLHYYYYLTSLSEEAHNEMHASLSKSLESNPNSPILQALMSNVYGNSYVLDYEITERSYEKFGELIERAYKKERNNYLINAILAFKCFVYDEKSRFLSLADEGLKRVPTSPLKLGTYGLYLCLYGEWEKGIEVINRIKENNIDFPKWLYGASCLYFYKDGKYEEALVEANLYQLPNFYWGPALRAACLAQLNRPEEARKEINTLLEWWPDFTEKGGTLIGRYIKQDSLLNEVLNGLSKAGLSLS